MSNLFFRSIRIGQTASLIMLPILGATLLLALHGWTYPHASFTEFTSETRSLGVSVALVFLFVAAPALFLVFGSIRPITQIRAPLTQMLFGSLRRTWMTATATFLLLLSSAVLAVILHRIPTAFDKDVSGGLLAVHMGDLDISAARIATLDTVSSRYRYDHESLAFLKLGNEIRLRQRDRNEPPSWWRSKAEEVAVWLRRNHRLTFDAQVFLGQATQAGGDASTSRQHFTSAFDVAVTDAEKTIASRLLGDNELDAGRYDEALKLYETGLVYASGQPRGLLLERIGICRYQKRDWAQAESSTQTALELLPNRKAVLMSNLGLIRLLKGNPNSAIDTLVEADRLGPDDPVNLMNLGIAYVRALKHTLADDAFLRAERTLSKASVERSSDLRLLRLIQAWSQLTREHPDPVRLIDFIRVSQGLRANRQKAADIRSRPEAASLFVRQAAEDLLRYQNMYGLEFIAGDLLKYAASISPDNALRKDIEARLAALPPSAQERDKDNLRRPHDSSAHSN